MKMKNKLDELIKSVSNDVIESLSQEVKLDWAKDTNGEYIYKGFETITTIKTNKQINK